MSLQLECKKLMCCCVTGNSSSNRIMKKRLKEHTYCGCKESRKQRSKMKSCDVDRKILLDEEVLEAIDYDFTEDVQDEYVIENPETPLGLDLESALHPQSDIIVQGTVEEDATRFAINLVVGRNECPDIAFHLNPRLDQLYSARNSRLDGEWGHEEGNSQQRFPFKRGHYFHLQLFLTHSEFLVAVNGTHYCSYTYRTSLLNITGLQVEGGVKLSRIHLHSTAFYPSPLPPNSPPCPFRFNLPYNGPIKNSSEITPVYGILQEKLKVNSMIEIDGRVKLLPFSFYINLQEGSSVWPHPEVPLHVSIRFNQGGDHVILANAWLGDWGREQLTHTKCLFTPGYPFVVRIKCSDDGFIATVDNQPLLIFKHRVPFTNVDTLFIQGDVYIYNVQLHQ